MLRAVGKKLLSQGKLQGQSLKKNMSNGSRRKATGYYKHQFTITERNKEQKSAKQVKKVAKQKAKREKRNERV